MYKDVKELHVKWCTFYWTYSIQNAQLPSASEQAGIEMTNRPAPASGSKSQKEINYWDLFVKRCQQESVQIQKSNWILTEDVLSCSATATIAVPGVAIGIFITGFLKCLFKNVWAKCLKKTTELFNLWVHIDPTIVVFMCYERLYKNVLKQNLKFR